MGDIKKESPDNEIDIAELHETILSIFDHIKEEKDVSDTLNEHTLGISNLNTGQAKMAKLQEEQGNVQSKLMANGEAMASGIDRLLDSNEKAQLRDNERDKEIASLKTHLKIIWGGIGVTLLALGKKILITLGIIAA